MCGHLSEHGLEEVSTPEPLGDLGTEEIGSVVVLKNMEDVPLRQLAPVGGGGRCESCDVRGVMEGGTIAFNQHCIQWLQNLVINSSVCMVTCVQVVSLLFDLHLRQ